MAKPSCPQHGAFEEHWRLCPGCIAEARSLVSSLHHHAVTGQLSNFGDLGNIFDYLHLLLTGMFVDGRPRPNIEVRAFCSSCARTGRLANGDYCACPMGRDLVRVERDLVREPLAGEE